MGKGIYTDGNLYVETWVGDKNTDELSQIQVHKTGVFHVIEVENGSTVTRDVRVVGSLPQGTCVSFMGQPIPDRWEDKLCRLTSKADSVMCEMDAHSSGDERIQCLSVEYQDFGASSWQQCTQKLPVEISIKIDP